MNGLQLGKDPIPTIVADYQKNVKNDVKATLAAYKTWPNQIEAIVRGLRTVKGKVYLGNRHQNHIKKHLKSQVIIILSSSTPTANIHDFEDLFKWVYDVLHANGIIKRPCLWVYDIALRMGQVMSPKIEPQQYVYLYAGAYKGAKKIVRVIKGNKASLSSFEAILRKEGAIHVEDIMCDYCH